MTELLTAAQMRAIEAAAIASGEVTGLELMERAGRGVVEAIFGEWPELGTGPQRAVVLCGPGNNGGDGFVVARLLKGRGWEVEVFLYGDAGKLPPDARVNYERWLGMGEVTYFSTMPPDVDAIILRNDTVIVVDALFGLGLSRPVAGQLKDIVQSFHADGDLIIRRPVWPRFVSVDVPSGICSESGRILGAFMPTDLTVSFHHEKLGHRLHQGGAIGRRLKVIDIGLSDPFSATSVKLVDGEQVLFSQNAYVFGTWLGKDHTPASQREMPAALHKYSHGHALILSGPSGHGGAARLSARGALRIGAGVVTVGCPAEAIPENAARLDAVMLRGVADAGALAGVLEDGRINALCLGPAMGTGAREAGLVRVALAESRAEARPTGEGAAGVGRASARRPVRNLVLDADALTILSQDPDLFAALHEGCVLTPHAGEFARLFPDIAAKLAAPATKGPAYSKVDATREAAARAGCVVLYKGPDTVIADPSGRCAINSAHYDRAAPWLATAGSGDVLAGFIAGLLARGFGPFDAACTAAWLHVECALSFGPGLIAEDLPEELPKVFRALEL